MKHSDMFIEKYRPDSVYGMVANRYQTSDFERAVATWKRGTAIVLSGPSGCGKTLAIEIIAKKFGLSIINGSVEDLVKASTESSMWSKGRLLVGDLDAEISVGDAEKITEVSTWPIVFVTEDIYQRNLIELRKSKSAAVINFQKANVSELSSFLKKVCVSEGISHNERLLYDLAYRSDGDVRFALMALESLTAVDSDTVQSIERDKTERLFERLDSVFKRAAIEVDVGDLDSMILENLSGHYRGEELARAYGCVASANRFQRNGLGDFSNELIRLLPVAKTQLRYAMPTRLMNKADTEALTNVAVQAHCSVKKARGYLQVLSKSKPLNR